MENEREKLIYLAKLGCQAGRYDGITYSHIFALFIEIVDLI